MAARRFSVDRAERALTEFASATGLAGLPRDACELVSVMIGFYAERRPRWVAHNDGDGLLWQWGPSDDATGPGFLIDLTRQFTRPGRDGTMFQLSLSARFAASPTTCGLGRGHEWCFDPSAADDFGSRILASAPLLAVAEKEPIRVAMEHERL